MANRIKNPVVDLETGELFEPFTLAKVSDGDVIRTKAQREHYQKQLMKYRDKTPFVWLNFEHGTNLDFSVDKAVFVRFLYFSTACGIDGIVQKQKLMTAKLDMNKNQKTSFLKQTQQAGLIRQDGSAFHINPQIVSFGERKSDSNHIRIYCKYASGSRRGLCS